MSYSFISGYGSTPQERLKNVEGFDKNHVRKTTQEANAFLQALKDSEEPLIFHKVTGNDVYSYNVKSKGDVELTSGQIADLKSRYDFSNLTGAAYQALLAELNMLGVIGYGQSKPVGLLAQSSGTIEAADIGSYIEDQIGYAKKLLAMLRANPNADLLSVDSMEKSVAGYEKLDRVIKQLTAS